MILPSNAIRLTPHQKPTWLKCLPPSLTHKLSSKRNGLLDLTPRMRLGQSVKYTLGEQFRNQQREQRESTSRVYMSVTDQPAPRKASPGLDDSNAFRTNHAIAQVRFDGLQQLRTYITPQNIEALIRQAEFIDRLNEISPRILQLNAAPASQRLWIQGPFQAPRPSWYTLLSAYFVRTVQSINVPVLYHFCDSDSTTVEFVYSLLAQLLLVLPGDFQSERDFSCSRFKTLDGTSDSLDGAVALFKDLLGVGPNALYVVVDGLQMLSRSSSSLSQLQDLVDALGSASADQNSESIHVTKTLFTTDGFTDILIGLEATERLNGDDLLG